ncbi:MAG: chemotaxis protein CheW [Bacteroidota bacterium]
MEESKKEKKQQSYLSFRLGKEEFAANVSNVLEILEMPAITSIPHAPEYMRGVINLRGKVLPVLDTRLKFGLQINDDTVDTSIIVLRISLEGKEIEIGALVDGVEEVMELSESDMEPAPKLGSDLKIKFIEGMVKNDDKFIMILNMDKVFSGEELLNIEEATTSKQTSTAEEV